LRETLKMRGEISFWWLHNVSFKNFESDPTYNYIIQILVIEEMIKSITPDQIFICGGFNEVINVLKNKYNIIHINGRKKYKNKYLYIRGFLSRVKYCYKYLHKWRIIKGLQIAESRFDAIFYGFWDWSIKYDEICNGLVDRYFKSLPDKLSAKNINIGWFLWFDPFVEHTRRKDKLKDIVAPIAHYNNLIIMQSFLGVLDLARAIFDLRPFFTYVKYLKCESFRKKFIRNDLNYYSLFDYPLKYGFVNSGIPHHYLVYIAGKRCLIKYKPKVTISFLELFVHSRALYCAANTSGENIINCSIQHGSYSRETTFNVIDKRTEYEGEPDGCKMYTPDYWFVMGELGRDIIIESGFPQDRVMLTGSSRYEHIVNERLIKTTKHKETTNILLVPSLDKNSEIEMIGAVCEATKNIQNIKLYLRNHPFSRIEDHPEYFNYKDRICITNGSLDENLECADLIVFSYSAVAQEALLRCIPVMQWITCGCDASVFRDISVIPKFSSIQDLRNAMQDFIYNPSKYIPSDEVRQFVLRKCFYKADGLSSERIMKDVVKIIADNK